MSEKVNKTKFQPVKKETKKYTVITKIVGEKFWCDSLYYRVLFAGNTDICWINSRVRIIKEADSHLLAQYTLPDNLKKAETLIIEWNVNKMTPEKLLEIITPDLYNQFINNIETYLNTNKKKLLKMTIYKRYIDSGSLLTVFPYNESSFLIRYLTELINKYYYYGINKNTKINEHIDTDDICNFYYPLCMNFIKTLDIPELIL